MRNFGEFYNSKIYFIFGKIMFYLWKSNTRKVL